MRSLLVHWNINAQSTFGLGGKRQVKGQRRSCGIWHKGQLMGNEPDMSEPLKSKASKTGEKCPKEQSNDFLSLTAFVPKDPAAREKKVGEHFTGVGQKEERTGLRHSGALSC